MQELRLDSHHMQKYRWLPEGDWKYNPWIHHPRALIMRLVEGPELTETLKGIYGTIITGTEVKRCDASHLATGFNRDVYRITIATKQGESEYTFVLKLFFRNCGHFCLTPSQEDERMKSLQDRSPQLVPRRGCFREGDHGHIEFRDPGWNTDGGTLEFPIYAMRTEEFIPIPLSEFLDDSSVSLKIKWAVQEEFINKLLQAGITQLDLHWSNVRVKQLGSGIYTAILVDVDTDHHQSLLTELRSWSVLRNFIGVDRIGQLIENFARS